MYRCKPNSAVSLIRSGLYCQFESISSEAPNGYLISIRTKRNPYIRMRMGMRLIMSVSVSVKMRIKKKRIVRMSIYCMGICKNTLFSVNMCFF